MYLPHLTLLLTVLSFWFVHGDLFQAGNLETILADVRKANQGDVDYHKYYKSTFLKHLILSDVSKVLYEDSLHIPDASQNKTDGYIQKTWVRKQYGSWSSNGKVKWVQLGFNFPFFGFNVSEIAVSVKGFLAVRGGPGEATGSKHLDYIAPLMTNFEANSKNGGKVSFAEVEYQTWIGSHLLQTSQEFVVAWKNVSLADQPDLGLYTFQVALKDTGRMLFTYQELPEPVFDKQFHSLTVGLPGVELRHKLVDSGTCFLFDPVDFRCQDVSECGECVGTTGCSWCQGACATAPCSLQGGQECDGDRADADHTDQPPPPQIEYASVVAADEHSYYLHMPDSSDPGTFRRNWVDMDRASGVRTLEHLGRQSKSSSTLRFRELGLNFSFYGHDVDRMYVTTEGFLSFSSRVHANMDKTQYIAPLKANYDFSLSHSSTVRYHVGMDRQFKEAGADGQKQLTVQWHRVFLQDLPKLGSFTFQVTLRANGDIVFAYEHLPVPPSQLPFPGEGRPPWLEAGISDAFVLGQFLHPYHKIDVDVSYLRNSSVVRFEARKTCHQLSDCRTCLSADLPTFECAWCPSSAQCSSGMDRLRQDWEGSQCHVANVTKVEACRADVDADEAPVEAHYDYYNVSMVLDHEEAKSLWVTSSKFRYIQSPHAHAHRVGLTFPFPYYGHPVHVVQVYPIFGVVSMRAEGPLVSYRMHRQYLTPLRGHYVDFRDDRGHGHSHGGDLPGPDHGEGGVVRLLDDGQRLVIQWDRISYLVAQFSNGTTVKNAVLPRRQDAALSTSFQATLHRNGDIDFVYKRISRVQLKHIRNLAFRSDVVMLSDAYHEEGPAFFDMPLTVNTYTQYHSIGLTSLVKDHLDDWTAIRFTALPTCHSQLNCTSCLALSDSCHWCPALLQCSNGGRDRFRPLWESEGCPAHSHSRDRNPLCPAERDAAPPLPTMQQNITDHHKFYRSHFMRRAADFESKYWVHVDPSDPSVSFLPNVSSQPRQRDDVVLDFDFPFYGQPTRQVSVLTGGFLSLPFAGHSTHKAALPLLTTSQYIAPLMADFDTGLSNTSSVYVLRNEDSATFQWTGVRVSGQADLGEFTFQVTLKSSGDMVFAYKSLPCKATAIDDRDHPVKLGLSDAYYLDQLANVGQRNDNVNVKRLYIYHELILDDKLPDLGNGSVFVLEALKSCNSFKSCWQCTTENTDFHCLWCPALGRCSNGYDRNRQQWDDERCFLSNVAVKTLDTCPMELVQTRHEYYSQTAHVRSRLNSPPSPLDGSNIKPQGRHIFYHSPGQKQQRLLAAQLPFPFPFYGATYRTLLISTNGFASLQGDEQYKEVDYERSQVAPLKNFSPEKHPNVTVTYGVSGEDEYVVNWREPGRIFELRLQRSGAVVFKYEGTFPHDDDGEDDDDDVRGDYFIGIASTLARMNGTQEYAVQVPAEHVRSGLTLRYEPLLVGTGDRADEAGFADRAAKKQTSSAWLGWSLATSLIVVVLLVLLALFVMARRHPASCPGQLLVRVRMTIYRMERGPVFNRMADRRASTATTATTATLEE